MSSSTHVMKRTAGATAALLAMAGLAACGSGGSEPLTQDQVADALLTDEDFPLDGWSRGEVEADFANTEDAGMDLTGDLPFTDAPEDCIAAMEAMSNVDIPETGASIKAPFTLADADPSEFIPAEVEVQIIVLEDGENPFENFGDVNDACSEVEISEEGMTGTITFAAPEDADGTVMTMDMMGINLEVMLLTKTSGDNLVLVAGTGVEQSEAMDILNKQIEKVEAAG